ncbi:MAG: phosphoribosylamine--glycine ligase [Planctomycetes bacterium]|nr:phosphoribosylamine--glycine ligase [Planctomycetota bacterium]
MNVLLVGNGGREHAVAWKLKQSKELRNLYIAPGNAGTARCGENIDISDTDIEALVDFAKGNAVGLVVVGPEDPLSLGLVDAMEAAGIAAFGPRRSAAQLEADKAFAKQLMRSSSISTAEGRVFDRFSDAKAYIASRDEPVVIKAAGLAKGKGVVVCDDPADGILAAEKIMCDRLFGDAGNQLIVEDKLLGEEASILAFVDGKNIYMLESSQDHKPIGEGDAGANTGGMGAYSPAPVITDDMLDKITREILVPIVDGMKRNETPYKGVLYAGLMITTGGPRVLEFNVRFGDPEIQAILVRLKSDLLEVFQAVCEERLDEITLVWDPRPAVCVVMASGGYPGDYETGKAICGIEEAERLDDVVVFHAGTKQQGDKVLTNGGRVLGVTALGQTTREAQARAYEAVERITFAGAYYRKDIANKAFT